MSEFRRILMMTQWENTPIVFEDPEVKRICVVNFGGESGIRNVAHGTVGIRGVEGEVTYRQAENVKSLAQLFKNNSLIRRFNELKYFNNVVSLYHTFNGCKNLEEISLPRFTKVDINCAATFVNCVSLTKINGLSNIKKITVIDSMFSKCESLEHIDFTGIDISGISNISFLFANCTRLKTVNFGNTRFNNVISYRSVFMKCINLEELINLDEETFGINSTAFVARYQASAGLFHTCTKLITEDFVRYKLHNFNGFSGDTFVSTNNKYYDFRNCTNLKGISFASFSDCRNNEGFTLPDVPNFIIDGCFYDYTAGLAKFPYHRKYIRFLSETPPNIKNNYANHIPLNWYVPSNAIQSYRDYINSINSYFTFADKVIIKPLDDWESDCDTFGWTKY